MTSRPVRNWARSRVLHLERLERRDAPAFFVSATQVKYEDIDGDDVTVRFSKPVLTEANVNSVFYFDTEFFRSTPQQLRVIGLDALDRSQRVGLSITTTATRSPFTGGDGFAAVGHIGAEAPFDLGTVTIDGDLGSIAAGDADTKTPALKGLVVHSMGRYGTSTGSRYVESGIRGTLGFLKVKSDLNEASISVGNVGPITIGGSLLGGRIQAGNIGPVSIKGDVVGGRGLNSGRIFAGGSLASMLIGGSLRGGSGMSSGQIKSNGAMGLVKIAGSVIGNGVESGTIYSGGTLAGVHIGGSLIAGPGQYSGSINAAEATGPVTIVGDVVGGGEPSTGMIYTFGAVTSINIGGSLRGGTASGSGQILASGAPIGSIKIAGDVVGGSASGSTELRQTGYIEAQRIGNLTLGGSLIAGTDDTTGLFEMNGSIRVADDLGPVLIKGQIAGNATHPAIISARGALVPTNTSDVAIASLKVLGRVEFAQILAGVLPSGTAANADAQIGSVTVGGDWIASSVAAGVAPGPDDYYGTEDDAKFTGVMKDALGLSSRIGRVSIAGQALGTLSSPRDAYGFVAENVSAVTIGGTPLLLDARMSTDDFLVGLTTDFKVNEV